MWGLSLRSDLQPIVDAQTGQVIGHEALLRGPAGSDMESPAALFAEAVRRGETEAMETEARRLAVSRLADLPLDQDLFVNVDPILSQSTPPIVPPRARVVLEISETRSILNESHLMDHIARWRTYGYRIALDDYGAGYMGLGTALMVRPDVVKIDRSVTVGAVTDPMRQAAVIAVLYVANVSGAIVIAEGVETPQDFWLLRQLGIRYMQGFLLGKPQYAPHPGPIALPPHIDPMPTPERSPIDVGDVCVWQSKGQASL